MSLTRSTGAMIVRDKVAANIPATASRHSNTVYLRCRGCLALLLVLVVVAAVARALLSLLLLWDVALVVVGVAAAAEAVWAAMVCLAFVLGTKLVKIGTKQTLLYNKVCSLDKETRMSTL